MSDPWKDTLATEAYLNDDGGADLTAEREAIKVVMAAARRGIRADCDCSKCVAVKDALATLAAKYGDAP